VSDYTAEHKVPTYQIRELTNTDDSFYSLVGPMLSRREIVAELGGPVWDDDQKRWQLAVTESGDVLAMLAVKNGEVCSFYVTPGSRGLSVGYAMLHHASRGHDGPMKATATDASRQLFLDAGFTETGQRGRFHLMRRGQAGV
jgi:hypothetical protein